MFPPSGKARDFTVNKLDLTKEVVGVLPKTNMATYSFSDLTDYKEWTSFIPSITATTTNPVFTNSVFKCSYKITGKSMKLIFNLVGSTTGSYGTGTYKIVIPNNYKIDTTKINLATLTNYWNATILCLSYLSMYDGSNIFGANVYALSDSELIIRLSNGNWWSSGVHGVGATTGFVCEFPII